MKRIFVAIKIHPQAPFYKVYTPLKEALALDQINWVRPENTHITLKFFGATPNSKLAGIRQVLRKVAANHAPFPMQIYNVGIFGSHYQPRVIWMGVDHPEPIIAICDQLFQELEQIGFPRDRQNFVPHLTIARIKKIKSKRFFQQQIDQVKNQSIQTMQIDSFQLFESQLTRDGAQYRLIENFPLQGKKKTTQWVAFFLTGM